MKVRIRTVLILSFTLISVMASSQKYFTKSGRTEFKASVDTFEPVEAVSENTTAILNLESGEFAALIFVKSFHFKVALMEEHFNENYMDSDIHPKATFKGSLEDFNVTLLSDHPKEFTAQGNLMIKGKSVEKEVTIKLSKKGDIILVQSEFQLTPEDFGIDIPSIVRDKISENILITLNYELHEK